MVITKLFYGLNEIIRIYKDNVIIWESATKISLIGYGELKTYALGKASITGQVVFSGFAEIDTFGSGVLVPVAVFRLSGNGEAAVNGLGDLYAAPIVQLEGSGESNVYGLADLDLLQSINSSGDIEIKVYEAGQVRLLATINGGASDVELSINTSTLTGYTLPIINSGGDTDIIIRTSGSGESVNIVQMPIKEAIGIITYAVGEARNLDVAVLDGATNISVNVSATILTLLEILGMIGSAFTDIYATGAVNVPEVVDNAGKTVIPTYTEGDATLLGVVETNSEVEIFTDTYGKLSIWYLPFIDTDGTLYIRQAYSAQVVDGVLEVS